MHTVMLYICIIVYCLMVMCHWKNYNQDDGEHPLSWVIYLQSQCQKIAHSSQNGLKDAVYMSKCEPVL